MCPVQRTNDESATIQRSLQWSANEIDTFNRNHQAMNGIYIPEKIKEKEKKKKK
jgi:hypothetical protein